jgi:threonyl-tRNA synthetase
MEQQKGKSPMLPLWLSPTQVRLIPISEQFLEKAEEITAKLEANCIRVDIDDSSNTLQKRIREAETEWVPYVVVIGQKEIESGVLAVRVREEKGKVENLKLDELVLTIKNKVEGKPFKPLPLPRSLSKRPQFHG